MKLKKLIAALLTPALLGISPAAIAEENDESRYFDVLTNYAANLYIDEDVTRVDLMKAAVEEVLKDNPELMYKMIKAAFSSLDEYSEYYTKEEYEEYVKQLNHIFCGMGVIIQRKGEINEIVRVYETGGAFSAGVKVGDVLVEIAGESTEGKSLEEITMLAQGEEGTIVNAKVKRGEEIISFDIERRQIETESVSGLVLEGNIGYIEITNFAIGTPEEMRKVLEDFDSKGIKNIILDLRNNPGGILGSVVGVAEMIVPEGVIVKTMYRNEGQNEVFTSTLKTAPYKFCVLVNNNTASAAEVLTGALQDSGIGYVIGETTYGKGVIQNVLSLPGGDAIKITTGSYVTRDGHNINLKGIEPDEYIINSKKPIDLSRYEAFDYATKWRVGDSGKGVLAAKQRLYILGYYNGELNENFDTALEKAVNDFQRESELFPYGVLDISTQATLENKFYVLEETVDDQLFTAYEHLGGKREDLE